MNRTYISQGPLYTIWVGGSEVSNTLMLKPDADLLAEYWRNEGYDDVVVELVEDSPNEDGWVDELDRQNDWGND
jgi:hypothetical protein